MKHRWLFLPVLITLTLFASFAQEATAAPPETAPLGIVAVVNEEVVTSIDVSDRAKFIVTTAKLSNTPETMERLIPQVTRQLIDETLQLQEARRLNIQITDAQVEKAVADIASARGGTVEALYTQLSDAHIPAKTFKDQIRAQLAWSKVVGREIRPQIKVSDEEIELARLQESTALKTSGSGEVEIITLSLPVDKPEHDAEVKTLAEKLVGDLRAGASFEEVATQLGSDTAPVPAWVSLAQLDANLATALEKAVPGAVSNPARTADGYLIVKLLNRRGAASAALNDSDLLLKDILLKLKPDDSEKDAQLSIDIAQEVARYPGDCKSPEVAGINGLEEVSIETTFMKARFSELAPSLQQIVSNLSVGGVSEPFASENGIRLLMLCERIDAPPALAAAEEMYAKLMKQKMELETQKYMRNLRREAFIEFRQL